MEVPSITDGLHNGAKALLPLGVLPPHTTPGAAGFPVNPLHCCEVPSTLYARPRGHPQSWLYLLPEGGETGGTVWLLCCPLPPSSSLTSLLHSPIQPVLFHSLKSPASTESLSVLIKEALPISLSGLRNVHPRAQLLSSHQFHLPTRFTLLC